MTSRRYEGWIANKYSGVSCRR